MIVKLCAPTQPMLQISQKGLLLIPGVFIVLGERQKEKDSRDIFLNLLDYKNGCTIDC